uniref:HTH myb-type domain-containing protein n=1 Tax=Ananas comosus var. bracteatus TaxID=296719 RepID=A0A6V7PE46_ANACO|nr:unnamed protein product [Ananas comosus var. bracteatus]
MREEEEPSWFARWEEQLPRPDELTPLSQTLITPDLALAFDIPTSSPSPSPTNPTSLHHDPSAAAAAAAALLHGHPHHAHGLAAAAAAQSPAECDGAAGSDLNGGGGGGGGAGAGEEPARTLKRPRLVWTPQLHKRFVDAVAHLGIKNAVPKTIMQLMSVDGLTRENVASHLQKYRLYLKRMQGLTSSSSSSSAASAAAAHGVPAAAAAVVDPATDHLFATGPHHQQLTALHHHQHQQFYPTPTPTHHHHHHQHQQRHLGHYGASAPLPANGAAGFEHGFLTRAVPLPGMHPHRMVPLVPPPQPPPPPPPLSSYADDLESGARAGSGGRRELTLFPTGED